MYNPKRLKFFDIDKPAIVKGWLVFVILLVASIILKNTHAAAISINIDSTRIQVPIKSIKDLRDHGVVKQGFDYSCGSGALATLLTYGLGDTVSEREIILQIFTPLLKDEETLKKKKGLSLADLQGIAQARGHKAHGFKLTPEYLAKLKHPVIVFIKPQGYEHFAVLKGVRNDRVYLADPSLGNIRMPVYKFLDMWLDVYGKGIIFVVERQDGQWAEDYLLKAPATGMPQPEILTIREMLKVGNTYIRYPYLSK